MIANNAKSTSLAIAAILLFAHISPAQALPREVPALKSRYALNLDTKFMSSGKLQSKIQIVVDENFGVVESVRDEKSSEDSDLGGTVDINYSVVSAQANVRTRILLDSAQQSIVDESYKRNSFTTTQKDSVPGYSSEVFLVPGFSSTSAHRYIDKSGQAVFVTATIQNSANLFISPITKSYVQFHDAIRVKVRFVIDQPMGESFEVEELLSNGEVSTLLDCKTEGQVNLLPSLALPVGQSTQREQVCVQTKDGLTPIVLIKDNPAHEPVENINRVDSAAMRDGGREVTNPLFVLKNLSLANCLGYAMLVSLGKNALPENAYWIQGETTKLSYTLGTSPMRAILSEKFRGVLSVTSKYYDVQAEEELATNPNLQAGDLVLFTGTGGIAHAGIVVKENNQWWLEHKFEEGPVLRTPITGVHNVIKNLYGSIEIYRKK